MADKIAGVVVPFDGAPEGSLGGDAVLVGTLVHDAETNVFSVTLSAARADGNDVNEKALVAFAIEALRLAMSAGRLPLGVTQQTMDYISAVRAQMFANRTIDA